MAESTAEAQALIQEARARARRRRRRIALVVACAAALAVGTLAAVGGFSGGRAGARGGDGSSGAAASLAGAPRYFLDAPQTGSAYGGLEIRASATGKLVAQTYSPDVPQGSAYLPPFGLAATGPNSFVVGMMTPNDCETRFFRLQLDAQGRPGPLTAFGPTLPGDLTSLVASAGGGLVGYAVDNGCKQDGTSLGTYLGVFNTRTGQTTRWSTQATDIGQLSMSANGRLLAYTQDTGKPLPRIDPPGSMELTGLQVRVLPTNAPPGTVAERSRVVASTSLAFLDFDSSATTVLLSPTGTSFYLCSEPIALPQTYPIPQMGSRTITQTATITAFQTATGKATGVIADFTLSTPESADNGGVQVRVDCASMALDPSGRFLLVPYRQVPPNPEVYGANGSVSVAVINTATGAKSTWTVPFGQNDPPGWLTAAAVAW
jgi:hypothetical protein